MSSHISLLGSDSEHNVLSSFWASSSHLLSLREALELPPPTSPLTHCSVTAEDGFLGALRMLKPIPDPHPSVALGRASLEGLCWAPHLQRILNIFPSSF